jgi:hypothetical protein
MDVDQVTEDEVRRLARVLLPRSEVISQQITEHVLRLVPELAPAGAADAVQVVRHSTDQNIGAMLATLAFGVPAAQVEAPAGTQELVRRLIAGGGDVTHLLRAYRVGHELLWRIWTAHVEAEACDVSTVKHGSLVAGVLRVSSRHLFDFIDTACQRIVEEFPTSLEPAYGSLRGGRAAVVRTLLGSDGIDLPTAGAALGYDLQRVHVALVASPLSPQAGVRHELQRLIDHAGVAGLALPAGDGTWWGWLAWSDSPSQDELTDLATVRLDDVLVGVGDPARGREGFRTSHVQGREAEKVARLHCDPPAGVTRFRDVELASVLCADPERARRFAHERLGALAERDEASGRLRETLRVLLAHGHNRGEAARALTVHHKTVTYRVNQAERLLRRTLSGSTADLGAALTIHATFYGP